MAKYEKIVHHGDPRPDILRFTGPVTRASDWVTKISILVTGFANPSKSDC